MQFIWVAAPILVSVAAFATYVLQGHRLTVSTGFTVRLASCAAEVRAER